MRLTIFSFSTQSAGMALASTTSTVGQAATCIARAFASSWNSVLFATKSVSQLTSIITPSFAPARNTPHGAVGQSGSARGAVRQEVRTRVNVRLDGALAGRPARLLVDLCQAPGAKRLQCNGRVTLRLHQRLLAVHHTSAGLVAQSLDSLRVDLDCCAGQGSTRVKTPTHAHAGCRCAAPSIVNGEKRGVVATERVDAIGIMSDAADSTATRTRAHRSIFLRLSVAWISAETSWKAGVYYHRVNVSV